MRPRLTMLPILLGAAVCAAGVVRLRGVSPTATALLVAAAILTELLQESARERLREPVAAEGVRLAVAVQIAAVVLVGPWVGGLVAAAGAAVLLLLRPRAARELLLHAGAGASAAAAAGLAFRVAGGTVGQLTLLDGLVPLAALGLVYVTARALLVDVLVRRESFDPGLRSAVPEIGFGSTVALLALRHPWDLVAMIPVGLALHEAQASVTRVRRETFRALETFANIVDERDPSTHRHSVRVAGYVDGLARALGLPYSEIDRLRWAARLHDLGKVAVDSTVLRKPGRLDPEEWAAVRRHPRLSARLLQRFELVATQARAVELHHERADGRGYYGVRDDDLPLAAHFLIVADSYDAMTTDRPYRPGLAKEEALAEIERNLGTQFHPAVGRAFVAVQRGLEPAAVLTPEDLAELRGAHAPSGLRMAPARPLRDRAEALALGGVVAALVALAFGERWVAMLALAAAIAGAALRRAAQARGERLARSLGAALHEPARAAVFDTFVERVGRAWPLEWAALLSWSEDGLGGRLERESGPGADETALVSWLVRAAESGDDLIVAAPADIPRGVVTLALPLRRETSQIAGFVVLAAVSPAPRALELALLRTLDELGLALAGIPHDAAPPRPVVAGLEAV